MFFFSRRIIISRTSIEIIISPSLLARNICLRLTSRAHLRFSAYDFLQHSSYLYAFVRANVVKHSKNSQRIFVTDTKEMKRQRVA